MAWISTVQTWFQTGTLRGRDRQQSSGLVGLMRRLALGTRQRAEVWQLLADVLEGSGEDLGRMMDAVAEGYELQGRRLAAGGLREMRAGLGEGRLAARMAPYCGTAERILFEGLGKQVDAQAEVIILISRATADLLPPDFDVAAQGALKVKGKERELEVFRLS